MNTIHVFVFSLLLSIISYSTSILSQQLWRTKDNFDEILERLESVNNENCAILSRNQLFIPKSTVSDLPDVKKLSIEPVYQNRTFLLQAHNLALYQAYFYSFITQKAQDEAEPGFMYYFISLATAITANPYINSSSIYFAPNKAFTPSYNGFFNKTLPLFAPHAHRVDDYKDPYQLKGFSTMNTIEINDLGAIRIDTKEANYTTDENKINEWYSAWLPDTARRHDSKATYSVLITNSNGHNETFLFHGPPGPSDEPGPVKWTRPYYDCGKSNKWTLATSVPIVDLFPRHTGWRHIELPLYVAVSVVETDFSRIDINQCPISDLSKEPNFFADTAKCQKNTTTCEPIHGFGFRRGGYQCRCKPGYRLPKYVNQPFLGELIERATEYEYRQNFNCFKIENLAVKTQNIQPLSRETRNKIIGQMETLTGTSNEASNSSRLNVNAVVEKVRKVYSSEECQLLLNQPEKLKLSGDVAYGKETQFENQARMALKLAHFISAFGQIVDPKETFAEFRVPDKPLTKDQLYGETLSILLADRSIQGVGILFERNKFPPKETNRYFAPYAYRLERNTRSLIVKDLASIDMNAESHYTNHELFKKLRTRWMTSIDDLELFNLKIHVRYNSSGLNQIRYDRFPASFKASALSHGLWSEPYYDCQVHNKWLISYASPFFGWDRLKLRLEFYGIVLVEMKLSDLDINQCESFDYYASNAFKGTHKCDRKTTRCVPISGRKFESGGYKCECLQGFDFPYNNPTTYIDGQVMEAEYSNVLLGKPSRFETLNCKLSQE